MADWSEKTVEVGLPDSGTAKYYANPRLAEARDLLVVLRKHTPNSECIFIAEFQRGSDAEYDYLGAHVGWEIKGGFERLYRPHVIFTKRRADSWANARTFRLRTGSVFPDRPFNGPIEILERDEEELLPELHPSLLPLAAIEAWPQDQREPRRALIAALEAEKLEPREYFVQIEPTLRNGMVHYHLWHESARQYLGQQARGDLTAKCRTATLDRGSRKVVRLERWQ